MLWTNSIKLTRVGFLPRQKVFAGTVEKTGKNWQ